MISVEIIGIQLSMSLNAVLGIIITIILKFTYDTFLEAKATAKWKNSQNKLNKWLKSGVSENHPKTKLLRFELEKDKKKMEKADVFKFLNFFKEK